MFLQEQRFLGQRSYLLRPENRGALLRRSHLETAPQLLRRHRVRGISLHQEVIGQRDTIHYPATKADHCVDAQQFTLLLAWFPRIGHTADRRVNHRQTADAHFDILVAIAAPAAVRDGSRPILTGNYLFVGRRQPLTVHVEDGAIQPGKGDARRIFT